MCDDPEMVKHMVSYFYTLKYSCSNANPTNSSKGWDDLSSFNPQTEILTHAKMFAIAVKYQVDGLREFAAKCFRYSVHVAWDSDEFLQAFTIVLNSTPEEVRELRDILFETIHKHYGDLRQKDEIEEAFLTHPLFARDLLDRQWTYARESRTTESQCTVCHLNKEESDFASGLPKMCKKCDSGDWSGW